MKKASINKKIFSIFLAVALLFNIGLPGLQETDLNLKISAASAGDRFTQDSRGNFGDGYYYEYWSDITTGGSMVLGTPSATNGAPFKADITATNNKNTLCRTGKSLGSNKTHSQIGQITLDYAVTWQPQTGPSYICCYGWAENDNGAPLVEYYIVENWGDWRPPGSNTAKGTVTLNGSTYDIYETDRINQPSIHGNTTFKQYWSVKQTKPGAGGATGTIDVSGHFRAWEQLNMKLGSMYEVSLCIEGYNSRLTADVTKNVITIGGTPSVTTTPAVTTTTTTVTTTSPQPPQFFHSTFESGLDSWKGRGAASVTTGVTGINNSAGLSVTGRTAEWNGASREIIGFAPGQSYSLSTWVMQNASASEDFKLTLQYTDASGTEQYADVATGKGTTGQWILLENRNFKIPTGATNLLLYTETVGTTTTFYMDEAFSAEAGTPNPTTLQDITTTTPVTTTSSLITTSNTTTSSLVTTSDTTTSSLITTPVTTTSSLITTPVTTTSSLITTSVTTTSSLITTSDITTSTTQPTHSVKSGDINGNGIIDTADLILLAKHLAGRINLTDSQKEGARTISGSQTINSECLLAIIKYLIGEVESLPI